MDIVNVILTQLRETSVIMGLIALVGLLLQKKSAVDVFSGTVKTIIGFIIFIGSNAMSAQVTIFANMFSTAFNINGVVTQVEAATAMALNQYGLEVSGLVFVLGFAMNRVRSLHPVQGRLPDRPALPVLCVRPGARLRSPSVGAPTVITVVAGGIILGFCGAALPSFCQPFVEKLTGGANIAIGHFNCIGYAFSGYVGKLFTKSAEKAQSEEKRAPRVLQALP